MVIKEDVAFRVPTDLPARCATRKKGSMEYRQCKSHTIRMCLLLKIKYANALQTIRSSGQTVAYSYRDED